MKFLLSNILLASTIFISNISLSIASDPVYISSGKQVDARKQRRIEAIRQRHRETFELIEKAIEEGDLDKVKELTESLNQVLTKPTTELSIHLNNFYRTLSKGDIVHAKKLGYELIESSETSYTQKAYIHNALGNYFFHKGDFDNARIEFEKILEFPVKKKESED